MSWELPPVERRNGIIKWHHIVIKNESETQTLNTTNNGIVINNLHPYYTYDFSVAAVTVGIGPYASGRLTLPQDGKLDYFHVEFVPMQLLLLFYSAYRSATNVSP